MVFETIAVWEIVILLIFVFLFFMSASATAIFIFWRLRWGIIIDIWEDSALGAIPTRRDRARLLRFGDGTDFVLYLRRHKIYRPLYGKKIGLRKYAFYIDDKGDWFNVSFKWDKKNRQMLMLPTEKAMGFANSSLRKGFNKKYGDKNPLDKWLPIISIGLVILAIIILGISQYLNLIKGNEVAKTNLEVSKANKEVIDSVNKILSNLETIKSGGTGLVPAT